MIVRSAMKQDGTFSYEVWNGETMIEAGDGYPSLQLVDAAAQSCNRELHRANFVWQHPFVKNDYMSLEDILKELDM